MRRLVLLIVTLLLVIAAIMVLSGRGQAKGEGRYRPAGAGFAECLAKKGYVVYGATWCSYCKLQKIVLFGDQAVIERPPYVECEPKGQPHNPACKGKPIEGYPTWFGPNGRPLIGDNGFLSADQLSRLSGCPLK